MLTRNVQTYNFHSLSNLCPSHSSTYAIIECKYMFVEAQLDYLCNSHTLFDMAPQLLSHNLLLYNSPNTETKSYVITSKKCDKLIQNKTNICSILPEIRLADLLKNPSEIFHSIVQYFIIERVHHIGQSHIIWF